MEWGRGSQRDPNFCHWRLRGWWCIARQSCRSSSRRRCRGEPRSQNLATPWYRHSLGRSKEPETECLKATLKEEKAPGNNLPSWSSQHRSQRLRECRRTLHYFRWNRRSRLCQSGRVSLLHREPHPNSCRSSLQEGTASHPPWNSRSSPSLFWQWSTQWELFREDTRIYDPDMCTHQGSWHLWHILKRRIVSAIIFSEFSHLVYILLPHSRSRWCMGCFQCRRCWRLPGCRNRRQCKSWSQHTGGLGTDSHLRSWSCQHILTVRE